MLPLDFILKQSSLAELSRRRHGLGGILQKYYSKTIEELVEKGNKNPQIKSLMFASASIRLYNHILKEKDVLLIKGLALSQLLYQDLNTRNYNDIDLLVREKDIRDITKGFPLVRDTINNAFLGVTHHAKFIGEGCPVELHWRLSNNRFFYSVGFDELYARAIDINVNGFRMKTISLNDYAIYLAIHGAMHKWFRLKWLYDYAVLMKRKDIDWGWVRKEAIRHKQTNALVQATQLVRIYFHVSVPQEIQELYQTSKHSYFIQKALDAIKGSEKDNDPRGLKKAGFIIYMMKLKPDARSWLEGIWRLRTHPNDWKVIKLPKKLFFMYYFLRPFLLIYRHIFR